MRTLKILLLGAFIVVASSTATAQSFGIRAGANFADITGSNFKNTSATTGLFIGVNKEMTIIKSLLFIQPEVQYSQEGFSTKNLPDTKIDYLSVPILAKVYVIKLFSFETGPQFGFPINDNLNNYKTESVVTSWAFGMNLNLPLHLSITARYMTGLTDVIVDNSSKSQSFQIGAGFRF
ncbi:porin family protein [Flavobacterium sp. N3904]|uniref:porin family protein n=1 Tax=Flavobacterium sp. N3904 TaxID=2986835 RepID=UPI0022241AB7|nr:porin family protein [Flavobacterium sp. N3904]